MKRYKRSRPALALLRLLVTSTSLAVLVGGVTYAALQSQNATLQSSTISSATASLLIGDGVGSYAASMPGFTFSNVEPGGAPAPAVGNTVTLKNNGSTALTLRLSMNSSNYNNLQNATLSKVFFVITPAAGAPQQFSVASLALAGTNATTVPMGITIPAGQTLQLTLQAQMAADAISSTISGATIGNIDLQFSGTTATS